MNSGEKGFSLLEIMVVLVIMALAVGMIAPRVMRDDDTARELQAVFSRVRQQAVVTGKIQEIWVRHDQLLDQEDKIVFSLPAGWQIDMIAPIPSPYLGRQLVTRFLATGQAQAARFDVVEITGEDRQKLFDVLVDPFDGGMIIEQANNTPE